MSLTPLHILSARLQSDTPVCGVALEPYILVRRGDGTTVSAEEVPQEGQSDSRFSIKCRWYRAVVTRPGQVCWVHPERDAAIQCILCLRSKVDTKKSYHCAPECLHDNWGFHTDFHSQQARVADANSNSNNANSTPTSAALQQQPSLNHGYGSSSLLERQLFSPGGLAQQTGYHNSYSNSYSNSGEAWVEIARTRTYVPGPEDVGAILKFECTAHDVASAYQDVGKTFTIVTARVRPSPNPPRRVLVPITLPHPAVAKGRFTLLSYNMLADLYATPDQFGYCPSWALAWPYRKLNLVRELLGYGADIMCLQEVQSNHFADYLAPEMAKAGYTAIFKKKTSEVYTRNSYAIDGCATFFRRDKFALVKKYEVEFNKAALSLAETLPPEQKKAALNRLLKDNVALIAVLEALDPPFADGNTGGQNGQTASRRQLVCVANTHIHSNPELGDVKLWQVHTLLKGLEKIAASADIPMLVAGDFNATPSSAAHSLLVKGSVPPTSLELLNDPLGILKPVGKLAHRLPLASAYATVAAASDMDQAAQRQRRRLDPLTGEPTFTNITRDFKGTLDYVLYSRDSLVPCAALELPDESEVRSRGIPGLPNDLWSSDHVALMVEFQYRAPAGTPVSLLQPTSPTTP